MTPLLVERGKHIANGTYLGSLYAMEHKIAMNIAGGTHHSFSDRGEGFCLFNDIAIAANLLLVQKSKDEDSDNRFGRASGQWYRQYFFE